VHRVLGERVDADRREGAEADVEGDRRDRGAASGDRVDQRRRQVQASGRRGDRARGAREDGLVAAAIGGRGAGRARDVRRQRQLADLLEEREDRGGVGGRHGDRQGAAVAAGGGDGEGQLRRGVGVERIAGAERPARPGQTSPRGLAGGDRGRIGLDEQELDRPAARAMAADPGRHHARIVDDHHGLGREVLGQRGDRAVVDRFGADHQQASAVAGRARLLGDLRGWQVEGVVGPAVQGRRR
jgi:hypothetical protein